MFKPRGRNIATVIALVLAFSTGAVPASARVFNRNAQGSIVFPQQPSSAQIASTRQTTGDGFDWGYLAIGSGAVALALFAIGGTHAAAHRRRRPTPERSMIKT